jgi:hypothetical protein
MIFFLSQIIYSFRNMLSTFLIVFSWTGVYHHSYFLQIFHSSGVEDSRPHRADPKNLLFFLPMTLSLFLLVRNKYETLFNLAISEVKDIEIRSRSDFAINCCRRAVCCPSVPPGAFRCIPNIQVAIMIFFK